MPNITYNRARKIVAARNEPGRPLRWLHQEAINYRAMRHVTATREGRNRLLARFMALFDGHKLPGIQAMADRFRAGGGHNTIALEQWELSKVHYLPEAGWNWRKIKKVDRWAYTIAATDFRDHDSGFKGYRRDGYSKLG